MGLGLAFGLLEEARVTDEPEAPERAVDVLDVRLEEIGADGLGAEQRAALLRAAAERAGPLPLACYAEGEEAAALEAAGFQPLGPLRVLVKA